jgi:hypothetical protein
MKCIRPAIFACVVLLTLGAPAQQNPTGSGGQSRQPQATQPSQPQTAQPSQPAQEPQATQPSQSQPPQATQPAPAPPATQPPSIDDQVRVLTQELNLNDDQQGKIKTVLVDQREQASTVIADSSLTRDDKVQKIRALRETTIAKVRGVLNDDQRKKLDQMLEGPSEHPQPKEPPK